MRSKERVVYEIREMVDIADFCRENGRWPKTRNPLNTKAAFIFVWVRVKRLSHRLSKNVLVAGDCGIKSK
jgi:hypothetical protein